jgi:hypothetical protein
MPRSQPLAAITTLAVVAALFGLGGCAFHDMYQFPFGSQLVVVPGPGGTVELKPGPGAVIGAPGRVAPGGPGRAAQMQPAGQVPGLQDRADRSPVTESDREFRVLVHLIRPTWTAAGAPVYAQDRWPGCAVWQVMRSGQPDCTPVSSSPMVVTWSTSASTSASRVRGLIKQGRIAR